ncbi:solute carrier family 25 member 46-like [Amphibalanus amphitrite]|uniref:solute carrier family 25 member 46-like n=1 Tax=Amphibalanus amphitrite TaxID=1232801 RepID=UPI001C928755|nr:solute carrier family 25 member 46-like [Amphibalanus amphitrite]
MAGLDDYKFYMAARGEDSPFWERRLPERRAGGSARPTSLPLPEQTTEPATSPNTQYLVVATNAAGLIVEHVLTHPFVVLRRQCQVNATARRYHLTPVTLAPVLFNLHRHQGLGVLWKGLGSAVIVKGLRLAAEDLVSKVAPWPRELARGSSARQAGRHLLLKTAGLIAAAPFSAASLTESVQSEVASERPGVLDVFTEGAFRAVAGLTPYSGGRLLPVWTLVVPAALHGILHYILSAIGAEVASAVLRILRDRAERRRGAVPRARQPLDRCHQQLAVAAVGRYSADLLLYPLETVLHRLQLQGTRSIVDNLDTGSSVLPVSTRYEGALDCFFTILEDEGVSGLYKGIGTLAAQAATHAAALYAARWIIGQVALLAADQPPPSAAASRDNLTQMLETPVSGIPGAGEPDDSELDGRWREVRTPLTPAADRYDRYAEFDRYAGFDRYRDQF